MHATDKPQYDEDDQYQAENAAQAAAHHTDLAMVATEAAKQQDHQYDD